MQGELIKSMDTERALPLDNVYIHCVARGVNGPFVGGCDALCESVLPMYSYIDSLPVLTTFYNVSDQLLQDYGIRLYLMFIQATLTVEPAYRNLHL